MALGPLDIYSYPWRRIENYLCNNLMVGEYGNSLLYYPSLKCLAKALMFSSGAQEATNYLLFLKIENA